MAQDTSGSKRVTAPGQSCGRDVEGAEERQLARQAATAEEGNAHALANPLMSPQGPKWLRKPAYRTRRGMMACSA